MEKDFKNRTKIIWICIGFIISWVVATLLFRPQPGPQNWAETAGMILFYGYTWLIPIVGLIIGFTNDRNGLRQILRSTYWLIALIGITTITIIVSWNIRFSNDIFFVYCWILTTLWWLTVYFRMKFISGKSTYGNNGYK